MKFELRVLAAGIGFALLLASVAPVASAQVAGERCNDIQMLAGKCDQQSNKKQAKQAKHETKFPNATRKEPAELTIPSGERKALQQGVTAANNGDAATALKDLQPIADSSRSAYAKALALTGLALTKFRAGDTKGAIVLQKQALDSNALDNDTYFNALFTLASFYTANEDYPDVVTTLDTWLKESGSQSAEVYGMQGQAYYRLQKYPEAVADIEKAKGLSHEPNSNWDQFEMASYYAMDKYDEAAKVAEAALARDPNNSALIHNVITIYVKTNHYKKALALLDRAHANGQIKDASGYLNMAGLYYNIGLDGTDPKANAMKAVAIVKEGMEKGIVPPASASYEMLGDAYRMAGNDSDALAAYAKASPYAKTGEVDFKRGVVLARTATHDKEAQAALKQALAKGGLKQLGAAWYTLGNVEMGLKDHAAAIAAFKHAEQDPATSADARRMLKRLEQKKK